MIHLHAALSLLSRMDAPVVAAVGGAAAGAGFSLVCAADLAVAGESAKFTMAYTAAGLSPDGSSTYTLPRLIGRRRAAELMLLNRRLSAAEALDAGGRDVTIGTAMGLDRPQGQPKWEMPDQLRG